MTQTIATAAREGATERGFVIRPGIWGATERGFVIRPGIPGGLEHVAGTDGADGKSALRRLAVLGPKTGLLSNKRGDTSGKKSHTRGKKADTSAKNPDTSGKREHSGVKNTHSGGKSVNSGAKIPHRGDKRRDGSEMGVVFGFAVGERAGVGPVGDGVGPGAGGAEGNYFR